MAGSWKLDESGTRLAAQCARCEHATGRRRLLAASSGLCYYLEREPGCVDAGRYRVAAKAEGAGRVGRCQRTTRESTVSVEWRLEGTGQASVSTGIGFLDHMLESVARHGVFDLQVKAEGDLQVDAHHTSEDVAIALGRALDEALGDRAGLRRMGDALVPLDEAVAQVAVDVSGRGYGRVEAGFSSPRIGALPASLVSHFLRTLAVESRITLHARVLEGQDDHHRAEALFKAVARALDEATSLDPRILHQVPSTKGVL